MLNITICSDKLLNAWWIQRGVGLYSQYSDKQKHSKSADFCQSQTVKKCAIVQRFGPRSGRLSKLNGNLIETSLSKDSSLVAKNVHENPISGFHAMLLTRMTARDVSQ